MLKYSLIVVYIISLIASDYSTQNIDKVLFQHRHTPLNTNNVLDLTNPFKSYTHTKYRKKSKSQKKSLLKLSAIINNKAKINDKWYQKGDSLKEYKITNITPKTITLQSNSGATKVLKVNELIE